MAILLKPNKAPSAMSAKIAALKSGTSPVSKRVNPQARTKLQEIIEKAKLKNAELISHKEETIQQLGVIKSNEPQYTSLPSAKIQYNEKQQAFINLGASGQSCVLIGAAGTGKTTALKGLIAALLAEREIESITDLSHKHLLAGTPGILCTSYTRRAVSNMKKAIPNMSNNSFTIHKTLEFAPEYYEVYDEKTDSRKQTMRFTPMRHKVRKLDSAIQIVIIDEAGIVPIDLYNLLTDALVSPENIQFIYLGDLNQLPPVFGASVLGVKGLELKHNVIELDQVYRQALDSPIIRFAHRILSGLPLMSSKFPEFTDSKLIIKPWKKRLSSDLALQTAAVVFREFMKEGSYDPEKDMILIPQNVNFGSDELNKKIANMRAKNTQSCVYEVMASFYKHYFSVGESVMYEKEDCTIVSINHNGCYQGIKPQPESVTLDYHGLNLNRKRAELANGNHASDEHIDSALELACSEGEKNPEASHVITLQRKNVEEGEEGEIVLSRASQINALVLGYCMTVHKAQGSEWRKVFLLLHHSHAQMIFRELLYTAVTRAREELFIICEPESFSKGIVSQRVKGQTIQEKLEFFAAKIAQNSQEKIIA